MCQGLLAEANAYPSRNGINGCDVSGTNLCFVQSKEDGTGCVPRWIKIGSNAFVQLCWQEGKQETVFL